MAMTKENMNQSETSLQQSQNSKIRLHSFVIIYLLTVFFILRFELKDKIIIIIVIHYSNSIISWFKFGFKG